MNNCLKSKLWLIVNWIWIKDCLSFHSLMCFLWKIFSVKSIVIESTLAKLGKWLILKKLCKSFNPQFLTLIHNYQVYKILMLTSNRYPCTWSITAVRLSSLSWDCILTMQPSARQTLSKKNLLKPIFSLQLIISMRIYLDGSRCSKRLILLWANLLI